MSANPPAHNEAVPIRLAVRLVVVLLCAAGVTVSLISRDSRIRAEDAFVYYYEQRDPRGGLERIDDSRRLNPNYQLDIAEASLHATAFRDLPRALEILNRAADREPENAEVWVRLAQAYKAHGDEEAARRAYDRAKKLAPRFVPPDGP